MFGNKFVCVELSADTFLFHSTTFGRLFEATLQHTTVLIALEALPTTCRALFHYIIIASNKILCSVSLVELGSNREMSFSESLMASTITRA